jgi:phage recombination protein Bet
VSATEGFQTVRDMLAAQGVPDAAPLAVKDPAGKFTSEQIATISQAICPGYSPAEVQLFVAYCARTGLDPFSRQILTWKQGGKPIFHVGIDGFRVIAERSGKYAGQDPVAFQFAEETKPDGKKVKYLLAATATVYRRDFDRPVSVTAYWDEFAPRDIKPESSWDRMPTVMLGKCAEAQAIRKAFPNDLSGLYEAAELDHAPRD